MSSRESQPCHEPSAISPAITLPEQSSAPALVLPSAESLLESDEREAGLLSSAAHQRLQECFNHFPDICCNIRQHGVRARAALACPRGGMCARVDGHVGDSCWTHFSFMHLWLVCGLNVHLSMRKEYKYMYYVKY